MMYRLLSPPHPLNECSGGQHQNRAGLPAGAVAAVPPAECGAGPQGPAQPAVRHAGAGSGRRVGGVHEGVRVCDACRAAPGLGLWAAGLGGVADRVACLRPRVPAPPRPPPPRSLHRCFGVTSRQNSCTRWVLQSTMAALQGMVAAPALHLGSAAVTPGHQRPLLVPSTGVPFARCLPPPSLPLQPSDRGSVAVRCDDRLRELFGGAASVELGRMSDALKPHLSLPEPVTLMYTIK